MSILHVVNHPLIQHKLTRMRDKNTGTMDFRQLLHELSMLMGYEVTRDFQTKEIEIETPIQKMKSPIMADDDVVIVPILRAGLGMTDGLLDLMPMAKIGHIGLYRDETTHQPVEYYCKIPEEAKESNVIVVDPMLATGGSASAAIQFLKDRNCKHIRLMCLVAAPAGIEVMQKEHPDVDIYVAAVDQGLNENCYIVPGLGDAGDRIFGTK
ncbi:MAG TPA: uracil phosphoribosyltransferase [Methanocorpusculum sp.]|nr:uracil phosphoribosyltransferase [Methanocorpusculum sp.]HJJ39878.1 uracil phosphoribosyltransferase [Methanocorpusculum sp.]HJJ49169.1 uracil phosphoribosyltransferase [Methanocorpusculum sp.]HJJ56827.1 uracil phosphoribosyltransferase [Methanocorpusculum sp.]